jgi:hypothetical protein
VAFERIKQDQEVLILWSNEHYKSWAKPFAPFMPKLWVMICPRGAYEAETNINHSPKLTGEARWLASQPVVSWKPDVMI